MWQDLKKIDPKVKIEDTRGLTAGNWRQKEFLMQRSAETVCIRCGQLRVFLRKWKDRTNDRGTLITHTESVCPDSLCQKIVDAQFTQMREKREMSEEKRKGIILARRTKSTTA